MKHYDYVEWVLYKKNLLDHRIHEEMEEHLYICDECMEIFLSLIDEEEIKFAGNIVPEDFTNKVMKDIKGIRPMKRTIKKKVKPTNDFFMYYVAVASVAIILTANGFFGKMVEVVPQITSNINMEENRFKANGIYNFSEKITNSTSNFINDFKFNKK